MVRGVFVMGVIKCDSRNARRGRWFSRAIGGDYEPWGERRLLYCAALWSNLCRSGAVTVSEDFRMGPLQRKRS